MGGALYTAKNTVKQHENNLIYNNFSKNVINDARYISLQHLLSFKRKKITQPD